MKKEKEEVQEPSAPFWMTTFSDMVTLMMVFFILILSFSTVELDKFKGAMSSLKGALGIMPEKGSAVPSRIMNFKERMTNKHVDAQEKIENFENMIESKNLKTQLEIEATQSGIHVRIGSQLMFDIGDAKLDSKSFPVLKDVAKLIRGISKDVYVEGHTDNVPISTSKYPSNWELSTARAMSVVRYFKNVEGIPGRDLAAVGHGEFRPLLPNTTPERRTRNRRVEIFIRY